MAPNITWNNAVLSPPRQQGTIPLKLYSNSNIFIQENTLETSPTKRQPFCLTHWGRETQKCVSKLSILGSDNGLSPGRRQAIIRTNAGILVISPLRRNFSEILIKSFIFSFKKMRLKVSSAKRRPFCLGLNVLSLMVLIEISAWIVAVMPV